MKTVKLNIPKLVFFLILLPIVFGANKVTAQNVLDDIYQPEHEPVRKPVPYNYLRQADVMWKKKLWRMLDLRQKINLPLYYPTEPIDNRYSLIDLIIYGVENESMTVYDPDADDQFTTQITLDGINDNFGVKSDTTWVEDLETGEMKPKVVINERRTYEVLRYLMKEIWYFDKQRSMLQVRILGLCPIRMYAKEVESSDGMEDDSGGKDLTMKQVLWVYYPAFRNLFATHIVFNTKNDAERRTFEDIFSMRRFNSYIFEETNVYDNRLIQEYTKGLDSILESNKIQDWIRNWEHDLWEY